MSALVVAAVRSSAERPVMESLIQSGIRRKLCSVLNPPQCVICCVACKIILSLRLGGHRLPDSYLSYFISAPYCAKDGHLVMDRWPSLWPFSIPQKAKKVRYWTFGL